LVISLNPPNYTVCPLADKERRLREVPGLVKVTELVQEKLASFA
jgi:hypothetical protein